MYMLYTHTYIIYHMEGTHASCVAFLVGVTLVMYIDMLQMVLMLDVGH